MRASFEMLSDEDRANSTSVPVGYAGLERPQDIGSAIQSLFRRNALLMTAILCVGIAASYLALNLMPEQYGARATVVLDSVYSRVDPTTGQIETSAIVPVQVETEIDIMRSREFASAVADALNLVDDPFLNPFLADGVAEVPLDAQRAAVVSNLLANYRLSRRGESLAIDIFATHTDPEQSARIVNSIAEILIARSASERRTELQKTVDFLDRRVGALEEELTRGEEELASFIRDNELDRPTFSEQLLTELERARSLVALARARNADATEIAEAEAAASELEETLRVRTRRELTRLNMTRALETERSRYQAFVDRRNTLETQLDIFGAAVRQITRAQPTTTSYSPNRFAVLAAGVGLGAAVALATAAARTFLDRRLRSGRAVELACGLPNLAYVPRLSRRARRRPKVLVQQLTKFARSPYSQSVRSLLTSLMNRTAGDGGPIIAVASALASEGKTTLTLSLAVVAAQEMNRVLVLDLDMDQGGMLQRLDTDPPERELKDLLREPEALMSTVQRDVLSPGVDFISFRRRGAVPRSILTDPAYLATADLLRRTYALILVDTPPLLEADEAVRFASLADATLLVVRYDRSTTDTVEAAASLLMANRVVTAGTVLNGVEIGQFRRLGFGRAV